MINTFRRYLRKIQIKVAHIRSKFDVVMQNKIPHIKINEKHEKNVKIILRLLTVVGIASSIIAFSTWYYSLIFSLILFFIDQIFEQIIFTKTIMLVQPFPKNWNGDKWISMLMLLKNDCLYLGFGFSDMNVGEDFFNTLLEWNENSKINNGKIQLSLVQEDRFNYSVHIYPTMQRDFIKQNCVSAEKDFDKRKNAGKELDIMVTQMCFCKVFPMSVNCAYNILKENNKNIYVQLFDASRIDENNPKTYTDVTPFDDRTILFEHITVCKRSELDKEKNVFEYYNVPQY